MKLHYFRFDYFEDDEGNKKKLDKISSLWGIMNADNHNFNIKPKKKKKRKLFYKFARRLPKNMTKKSFKPLKFDINEEFLDYLKCAWEKTRAPASVPDVNHKRALELSQEREDE